MHLLVGISRMSLLEIVVSLCMVAVFVIIENVKEKARENRNKNNL